MSDPQPRFLILAPWQCLPSTSGAKLRTYHLARALSGLGRVTFLSFQEPGVPAQSLDFCEETISVPHPGGYDVADMIGGLLTATPMTIRKYTRTAMEAALRKRLLVRRYDAVQLEAPQLAAYVPLIRELAPQAQIFMDWHNIESEIMARYGEKNNGLARSLIARVTAPRLAAVEQRMAVSLDAHIACSHRDATQLQTWKPGARVRVIDNGVDVSAFPESPTKPSQNRILFVGAMDYHANIEGVLWFADAIWPRIRALSPALRLTVVGRNPAPAVRDLASRDGIEVTGTVADVKPYYHSALVSVVPLMVGGGSRLKILESMAARVPIVSTTLGAEGLSVRPGEQLEIADHPDTFGDAVLRLCSDETRRLQLSQAARRLVEQEYDWSILGRRLVDFYREVFTEPRLQGAVF